MLRRVTDLCFLKMPVNTVQYRVTVGIFNNRKLITNLRFELPSCSELIINLNNFNFFQIICPVMMQASFPYCFTFFPLISVFKGLCFKN